MVAEGSGESGGVDEVVSGRYVVAPYAHVGSDMSASLLRPFITAHTFYDSLYGVLLLFPWRLHTVPPGHEHDREVPRCRIILLCLTTMIIAAQQTFGATLLFLLSI